MTTRNEVSSQAFYYIPLEPVLILTNEGNGPASALFCCLKGEKDPARVIVGLSKQCGYDEARLWRELKRFVDRGWMKEEGGVYTYA